MLPAGERRDIVLLFRMNPAEDAALRRQAGDRPLAQHIRATLFGGPRRRARPTPK